MDRSTLAVCLLALLIAPLSPANADLAHVETRGEGDTPLVLVPGLVCDWSVWETFMERNADRYTLYAVTLPGMGGTEPLPTPETIEGTPWLDASVEAIASMIEEQGLDEPIIVGHSMGGTLAFRLSIEHGDLVGGAVVVDGMAAMPLGPGPMEEAQRVAMVNTVVGPQMLNTPEEQWHGQFATMGPVQMTDQEQYAKWMEHFKKTPARVGARYMIELMKTDVTDELARVKDPILLLAAENEPQAKFMGGEERVEAMWESQIEHAPEGLAALVWAPDSRHFIFFDKPEWFDARVAEFVKGRAID